MYKETSFENMEISEANNGYLKFMKDIRDVSAACTTKTYIWGGFTTDIFEGKFLREHHDLDGFIENMMSILELLISEYKIRGYHTEFRNDINMLSIRKENVRAAFNPLDIDGAVAMWRHIGDQGTVYFPYAWLDDAPRTFYDVEVYTSGLCFEYGLRSIVKNLNPEWSNEREKDKIAKEYLTAKIAEKRIEAKTILKNIWSYNPFWAKRGYDPFDKPTLVCPIISD